MPVGYFLRLIYLSLLGLLSTSIVYADQASSSEPVINETTSCPVAVRLMDLARSNNNKENHENLSSVWNFIKSTMGRLDSIHTENGEPGIVAQLSDEGFNGLVAFAIEHCREHPRMTIYNSAAYIYSGTRDMELGLGGAR